jgi:hypothetical protein
MDSRTTALASSGVAWARSFAARGGTFAEAWKSENRPSGLKMMMPLGVAPNGSARLPSSLWLTTETKDQAPTKPSLTDVACAEAATGARVAASSRPARLSRRVTAVPPG